MRFLDLLIMSINNLRRRKLRTALTVLGVVIGTASIVVMVSLGIGLNEINMEQIKSQGSLTAIDVRADTRSMQGDGAEPKYMTDDTLDMFRSLKNVKSVSPMLSLGVIMKQGVWQSEYVNLIGVTREYMEQIPLGEGELPAPGEKEMKLVVGNWVQQQFSNAKTGKGYYDTGEMPDVDFMNKPMFVIFDTDAYYQSRSGGSSDSPVKPPKKYMINTAGVVAGGPDEYNSYCYSVYVDVELLKTQLRQIFKKKVIPGQPTNKKGKPYPYFIYDQAVVYAEDMDHVTELQQKIKDLGYQASSQMDWLKQSQQQSQTAQAVLGGIGAVSLFVAAIGIANTMMMSIYERTKEIGVMKVLGCDMTNIRNMFLLESGFIGFMGGIAGLLLSFGISALVNKFLSARFLTGMEGDLSRIPVWLALAAIGFAIFVGMAAGFFPAQRAMKLSPLAAIRNE